jgi:hypothetical protein
MDKRDSEWVSPEKFWASQDRHELKRYWKSEEGQKMKQKLRPVEMQRQPATSYLPNQHEDEKAPSPKLSAKEYWDSPEGKLRKAFERMDALARRPKDLTPRLSTKSPPEPEKAVTTRTLGSGKPPCKECGAEIVGKRKRNGFCSEKCRKQAFRRENPQTTLTLKEYVDKKIDELAKHCDDRCDYIEHKIDVLQMCVHVSDDEMEVTLDVYLNGHPDLIDEPY